MRQVHILCPSYDGKVVCDFSVAMAEVFRLVSAQTGLELHLRYWMYEALLPKARNNLFTNAYNAGADDIIFIDGDQAFSPKAFFDLLRHPVDAVGVPVRMKTDTERYNIRPEDPARHKYDEQLGLLEVENIGTGFLRLSRKAMEVLWSDAEFYRDGDSKRRMICNLQIIDGGLISEDIQICTKLRDAGIKIYADVRYTCAHFGTKRFDGEYSNFLLKALTPKGE